MTKNFPIVGLCSCTRQIFPHVEHFTVNETYPETLFDYCNLMPLAYPLLGGEALIKMGLLDNINGILLTGSSSNVNPSLYGQDRENLNQRLDIPRDDTNMKVIRKAIKMGIPILAICRGLQEFNVAYGGSLYQQVHLVDGKFDHRSSDDVPIDEAYVPVHNVIVEKGGIMEKAIIEHGLEINEDRSFKVNSAHSQAIKRLGEGLVVEATAEDGTIEAFSVKDAKGFALAVQWHPEKLWENNCFYKSHLKAFSKAVYEYRESKK
jgi:putative glutamine amidotransferase